MAWLADQGASQADLDGQGFLTPKEKQPPESDYERLRRLLYEFGKMDFEHMTPEKWLDVNGFTDLAHAIKEGRRDAERERREQTASVCAGVPHDVCERLRKRLCLGG